MSCHLLNLTAEELALLVELKMLPKDLVSHEGQKASLKMSSSQLDDLRELCFNFLELSGFNEKYELTSEGLLVQEVADRCFKLIENE